jgi:hypothetical protein
MRTKIQAIADRLLLLYAIAKGNEAGDVDGTFKLMKIPFCAELYSTRARVNTFNYSFFRYTYGPFTTEIYEDADALCRLGLSTAKDAHPRVTDKGTRVLNSAKKLFEKNRKAVSFVEKASAECASLSFSSLKRKVYREVVMVNGSRHTIENAPKGYEVLSAISDPVAFFHIDDDWVDTLWKDFNYTDEEIAGLHRTRPLSVLQAVAQ